MGRLKLLGPILLLLCLLPVEAQVPPIPPVPPLPPPERVPVVGGIINEALENLTPVLENETREDLRNEQIDLGLLLQVRDVDYSLLGILFGGGKLEADVRAALHLDFRAVSVARLDEALQDATGDANVSLNKTFGIDSARLVLTAEEIRLIGGGVLLKAFQTFQEAATRQLVESTLPGVVVIQSDFAWSNVLPARALRAGRAEVPLREPPLTLDASVIVNYLHRLSAFDLARDAAKEDDPDAGEDAQERLKGSIEENQTLPPLERNAFMFLGYGQLLDLELPSGWRLKLTVEVPQGFTIESASEELVIGEGSRSATWFADGSARTEALSAAGVVTVSNRFLVTATLFAVVLLAGLLLRFVVESVVLTAHGLAAAMARRRVRSRERPRAAS